MTPLSIIFITFNMWTSSSATDEFLKLFQLPCGEGLSLADVFGYIERNRYAFLHTWFFYEVHSYVLNADQVANF